jgi:hypothetical protein
VHLLGTDGVWLGRSEAKIPPFADIQPAPNTLGESKSGRQHRSIEPFLPTSATV